MLLEIGPNLKEVVLAFIDKCYETDASTLGNALLDAFGIDFINNSEENAEGLDELTGSGNEIDKDVVEPEDY